VGRSLKGNMFVRLATATGGVHFRLLVGVCPYIITGSSAFWALHQASGFIWWAADWSTTAVLAAMCGRVCCSVLWFIWHSSVFWLPSMMCHICSYVLPRNTATHNLPRWPDVTLLMAA
jgi:hypothetical protein